MKMKTLMSKNHALFQPKSLLIFASLIFLMSVCLYFWQYSKHYISTENAYLNADIVKVAPRITGQVTRFYVTNNQFVKKGQILFELDASPFQIAYEKATAQLIMSETRLQNIQESYDRTMKLVKMNVLSRQAGDDVNAKLKSAKANVRLSLANQAEARLRLEYTQILAPINGWVTSFSLKEGDILEINQAVFAIISNDGFWVDANFKETEIESIKQAQHASIKIDMYPGKQFKGIVESISRGSGSVFSLMPPQNATGNWVKITQRVPVRVRLIDLKDKHPLRIGTSAKVTIDLQSDQTQQS